MKLKHTLIACLFAIALSAATARAAVKTYAYTFTGYCDGFSLNLDTNTKLVEGLHINDDCVGGAALMSGLHSHVNIYPESEFNPVLLVTDEFLLYPLFGDTGFWVIDVVNGVWGLYGDLGAGYQQLLNWGTLTPGAPPKGTGGVSVLSKINRVPEAPPPVQATYTFTFDGYCDGMSITQFMKQDEGTHDLSNCGLPNYTVSGAHALSSVAPPQNGLQTLIPVHDALLVSHNGGYLTGFWAIDVSTRTWAVYGDIGGGIQLINEGTFTFTRGNTKGSGVKPTVGR